MADNYYGSPLRYKMDRERQDLENEKAIRLLNNGALNSALKLMEATGVKVEGVTITDQIAQDPEALRKALAPAIGVVFAVMDALVEKINAKPGMDPSIAGPDSGQESKPESKVEAQVTETAQAVSTTPDPPAQSVDIAMPVPPAPETPEASGPAVEAATAKPAVIERPVSSSQMNYIKTLYDKAGTPENERTVPTTSQEASEIIHGLKNNGAPATVSQTRILKSLYDNARTPAEERAVPRTTTEANKLIHDLSHLGHTMQDQAYEMNGRAA